MPIITRLSNIKILAIDDLAGMRTQLTATLVTLGFERLSVCSGIREAMERLSEIAYDVIICDYYLGDATSGQQFLEHLRAKALIPPSTIFIMITAESGYVPVIRAAECAPDDYLVKPFTAAQFEARVIKLIEKRERLFPVHAAIEAGDIGQAVAQCDAVIHAKDRFSNDALKLKGSLLFKAGEYAKAQDVYQSVLDMRSIGWAQLGLARSLKAQNDGAKAETILEALIAENKHMMGAYDTLAEILSDTDRDKQALSVLQRATSVSPGTVARLRSMGRVAIAAGDAEIAEKTVRQLISEHKYSPVKEAGDYLMAASVLSGAGHPDEALLMVSAARGTFATDADRQTLSVAEATAHIARGDKEAAACALDGIREASAGSLDRETVAALGKALYTVGDDARGRKYLQYLVHNNPDDPKVLREVQATLSAAGKPDEAKAMVEGFRQEVIDENNAGVRLAQAGQLDEAIGKLTDAAERLPGNLQIISNAALVLALAISKKHPSKQRMQDCLKYRKLMLLRDPNHPKLVQIDTLLAQWKSAPA